MLINTDEQRIISFPSDFNGIRFKENIDDSFHILENKFKYDFFVAYRSILLILCT